MVKIAVFDFDGTIMDTEKFHYKAWINILQTHIDKNIFFVTYTPIKIKISNMIKIKGIDDNLIALNLTSN